MRLVLDKPNNPMKLDEKLGKIIDSYYDDLPADEQRVVDILQSKLYSYTSKTHQIWHEHIGEEFTIIM